MEALKLDGIHDRFWSKVDVPENAFLCWNWTACTGYGYGRIQLRPYGTWLAHRLSYVWFNGPLRDDKEIHHTCENRQCVNPQHLIQVTRKEHADLTPQAKDAARKTIRRAKAVRLEQLKASTQCDRGHNYEWKFGRKRCQVCVNMVQRARRRLRKQGGTWVDTRYRKNKPYRVQES